MKFTAVIAGAALFVGIAQASAQYTTTGQRLHMSDAANIALSEIGGGSISEIAWDTKDGRSVWEVEVIRGGDEHEVVIDATTGRIVEVERKGSVSRSKQRRLDEARLGLSQAMNSALAHTGGGRVRKVDLDREKDRTVYEFDIDVDGRKAEVNVDAVTGRIVSSSGGPFASRWDRDDRIYGYTGRDDHRRWGWDDRSYMGRGDQTWGRDVYGYRDGYRYESYPRERRFDGYETRRYYYFDDDRDDYFDDWDDYWDD